MAQAKLRKKLDWFALYVADWLLDTALLTLEQQGAYMRLLCLQWRDGALPTEVPRLAELCRCQPARFERFVWPAIAGFFEVTKRGLRNARLERERTRRDAMRVRGKEGGRISGAVRRSRTKGKDAKQNPPAGSRLVEGVRGRDREDLDLKPPALEVRSIPGSEVGPERVEIEPPTETLAAMGALVLGHKPDRDHPRSTSIPKDPERQWSEFLVFMIPYYPSRIGAGLRREIQDAWGQLDQDKLAAMVRELPRQEHKHGEKLVGWAALPYSSQKRIVNDAINKIRKFAPRRAAILQAT